jgi:hypothetical protein
MIDGAFRAYLPEVRSTQSGLSDVAEVCTRDYAARPAREWRWARDQLLLIGVEWDLAHDRLNQQSDSCLRAIVAFLR